MLIRLASVRKTMTVANAVEGGCGGWAQVPHLGRVADPGRGRVVAPASLGAPDAGPVTVEITNRRGLHARASARFVTMASAFEAVVTVHKDGAEVTGTSIMGLMMMLAAAPGDTIDISAVGGDADAAVSALVGLVAAKFGED